MEKTMATLAAAAMLLLAYVPVNAEESPDGYNLYMDGTSLNFLQGEVIAASYETRTKSLTLLTDGEGDLIVRYDGADGMGHDLSLGEQRELEIDGNIGLLDMRPTLELDTRVTIPKTATVSQLTIASGNVDLYGTATSINAKSAKAHVQVMAGANVTRVNTVSRLAVTGLAPSVDRTVRTDWDTDDDSSRYRRRSYYDRSNDDDETQYDGIRGVDVYLDGHRLRSSDYITVDSAATMQDASGELDRRCSARDADSGNAVTGTFRFNAYNANKATEGRHSWTFTPRSENYDYVSGTLRIYHTGNAPANAVDS